MDNFQFLNGVWIFFWNTLSLIQFHRCHALSLQQHKNYQKKKMFWQQRYLLLPPSPRWKPIALTESGKFDMLTPSLAHWNKTVHSHYFSTLVKLSLCPRTAPWRWQKHPTHFRLQQLITVTRGNFMLLPLHTHWGHPTSVTCGGQEIKNCCSCHETNFNCPAASQQAILLTELS